MRTPAELSVVECREILDRVQRILWHDGDQWDGGKVWEVDTIEGVAGVLHEYDLRPEELGSCDRCGETAVCEDVPCHGYTLGLCAGCVAWLRTSGEVTT